MSMVCFSELLRHNAGASQIWPEHGGMVCKEIVVGAERLLIWQK